MIRAEKLSKHYGSLVALDQVDLHVSKGEILGFLGPNGAGKSTALRLLSGYLPPTAGKASIAGKDLVQDSLSARAHLGYLPEHFVAPSDLRVGEYLRFRARLKGLSRSEAKTQIATVSQRLAIHDRLRQPFLALSKGFRQRIGLADALLGDPPALLLDEPFSGLDPLQREEFRLILRGLADDGKAILFSSHVLPEVEEIADRILVLVGGRARAAGTLADLRQVQQQSGMCEVRFEGEHQQALSELLSSRWGEQVQGLHGHAGGLRFRLAPEVPRTEIFQALAAADCGVVALQEIQPDLEDLFRQLVTTEAQA